MTSHSTARRNGTKPPTPAELKAEIAETREELSETAAALAAKADVKARVQGKAAEVAGTVRDRVADAAVQVKDSGTAQAVTQRPIPVAVVAAVISAAAVAFVLIRRSLR